MDPLQKKDETVREPNPGLELPTPIQDGRSTSVSAFKRAGLIIPSAPDPSATPTGGDTPIALPRRTPESVRSCNLQTLTECCMQGDGVAALEICRRGVESLRSVAPFLGDSLSGLHAWFEGAISASVQNENLRSQEEEERRIRPEELFINRPDTSAIITSTLNQDGGWMSFFRRRGHDGEQAPMISWGTEGEGATSHSRRQDSEEFLRTVSRISTERLDPEQRAILEDAYRKGSISSPESMELLRILAEIRNLQTQEANRKA